MGLAADQAGLACLTHRPQHWPLQGLAHRSWAFPNWHRWVRANPAAPGQMGDVSGPWVPHLQNGGGTTTACFTGGLRCSVGWRRALDESVGMCSHSTVAALPSWMNSIPRSLSFFICKTGLGLAQWKTHHCFSTDVSSTFHSPPPTRDGSQVPWVWEEGGPQEEGLS